ncbi:MAG: sulfotransferase [Pseudomonadota bacterium]|nr:sulfotransferase [Pseudomonadota bacterium]
MKTVVIVTHGRSGSTLLQGLLNAIPGYCIRGENNNVMRPLHRFYTRLAAAKELHGEGAGVATHAWYGIDAVSDTEVLKSIRGLMVDQVLRPPEGTKATGYKEIRFGSRDMQNLDAHLTFVRQVFPGVKFIFNVRDAAAAARSSWWQNDPNAEAYLREFQQRMAAAYEVHHDTSFWMRYEEAVDGGSAVRNLFDFLGDGIDDRSVRSVLDTRHSVRPTRHPSQ